MKHHDSIIMPVTCVIGEVTISPNGDTPVTHAAFQLIAEHDAPGTFSFETPDGYVYAVTVERDDPPRKVA